MESSSLVDTFLREAAELLSDLESGVLELEAANVDPELIDRMFRAAHTLKGNAGMVGYADFVRLTHVMENVLDCLRSRALSVSAALSDALLAALDQLRVMTENFQTEEAWGETESYQNALAALSELCEGTDVLASVPRMRSFELTIYLRQDTWQGNESPEALLDELAMLGEVSELETLFDRVPPLGALDAGSCHLGFRMRLRTDSGKTGIMGFCCLSVDEENITIVELEEPSEAEAESPEAEAEVEVEAVRVEAVAEEQAPAVPQRPAPQPAVEAAPKAKPERAAAGAGAGANAGSTTIRVDTGKLDRLLDLVGELVIGISHVRAHGDPQAAALRAAAVERLEMLGRDLQDQVMGLRMLPAQDTFERFRRPMRDLSKELGKPLRFEIEANDTQVDRKVLDQLVDPLKHMLRNCVAHGLEMPEERRAAGKPETGSVTLSATQREGHVVIEISDDGRGIDPARVRAKAEERGLVKPGQTLSEAQLYDLLFQPGFSTAAEVSEISGRGVGLDVVRRNIQNLRGSVEVESRIGRGTSFRIRLPLTLAIVEGMNVSVGPETVTIPLPSVVELIAPGPRTIQRVEGKHEYVDVRGELLPMLRLSEILSLPAQAVSSADVRVVLVETERRKFGLLVDRVLGMAQTVIKPLDSSYDLFHRMNADYVKPRSVGGAAILGDGNVGIILDVHGLEGMAFGAA